MLKEKVWVTDGVAYPIAWFLTDEQRANACAVEYKLDNQRTTRLSEEADLLMHSMDIQVQKVQQAVRSLNSRTPPS